MTFKMKPEMSRQNIMFVFVCCNEFWMAFKMLKRYLSKIWQTRNIIALRMIDCLVSSWIGSRKSAIQETIWHFTTGSTHIILSFLICMQSN